ncbi:MAG: hypothetical protein ACP5TX_03335 [Thermoplasmata archaeon]
MKVLCRSMDVTDKDIERILKNGYNDLTSLVLRLSKFGNIDFQCLINLIEYLDIKELKSFSELNIFEAVNSLDRK